MIAAIYARKSTEQTGVSDDQKSVTRQVEHAKDYAKRKGWRVAEEHIYSDDGISGAEFAKRPGLVRLLAALKPKPSFQVLIVSEESRLGRESIETAYVIKQLVTADVRLFFYLEDKERTLDTPLDKIMLQLTNFADEMERERARSRTYDAMVRKAKAGHVTGGSVFGYDNIDIAGTLLDAQGRPKRSHVELRINQAEAEVVRKIFRLYTNGNGFTTIAKTLNAGGAICPRPRPAFGKPNGWVSSSVRQILLRRLYRGERVWGRTKKRTPWGVKKSQRRAEKDWIVVEVPNLRIVPEDLWQEAQDRWMNVRQLYLRTTNGPLQSWRGTPNRILAGRLASKLSSHRLGARAVSPRFSRNLSLSRSGQGPEMLYPTGHEPKRRKVAMVFISQVVRGLRILIVAGQYLVRARVVIQSILCDLQSRQLAQDHQHTASFGLPLSASSPFAAKYPVRGRSL